MGPVPNARGCWGGTVHAEKSMRQTAFALRLHVVTPGDTFRASGSHAAREVYEEVAVGTSAVCGLGR